VPLDKDGFVVEKFAIEPGDKLACDVVGRVAVLIAKLTVWQIKVTHCISPLIF
jgi:hypothetical protein